MTCNELKNVLSSYCETGHGDDNVMIILSEKSIGFHAASAVESALPGFDWDNGRILIHPIEKLVRDKMSRDVEKIRVFWRDVLHCPTCERRVSKKAKYCEHCGQKFSKEIKVI